MRDRLTSLIAGFLLLALVGSTWWASDYARRSVPVDPPRRLTHEMDTFIDNFVMMRTDETGMPAARLEGPRAEHFPDDDSYEVYLPRAVSQRPDRSVTIATAERGRMDQDGDRIVMTGDVNFRRPPHQEEPGLSIQSEAITLHPNEDVAFTDLPATVIRGDGSRITGTGMRYDNASRQLAVASDARVTIAPRTPEAER
ncbi:LPS export ABC transporter periplasmic protein LptC [Achromobacter sp. GG226]|uniref:LPS export ABC transporter periplasmic protein LptC n=1 Tax=Verticiella alkaliphila TaxID=2779529 RepID=UPI001C0AA496|nr:LPS export ABC transporter periplasmic protein LptC [Verticiella sp. GG226]MBU4611339.1 LPS export ABC transporter periplasmic protein LptC [Verticiella sp. GG226]